MKCLDLNRGEVAQILILLTADFHYYGVVITCESAVLLTNYWGS